MAARAMWKAVLRLQREPVPVRLYAAVHEHDIHFHLLHRSDGVRVRELMVERADEEAVDSDEIQSGYALSSGEFVVLSKSDKERLTPKPSRDIQVLHAIGLRDLPLSAYLRPYWLGPDGDAARYFALVRTLEKAQKQAIVSWVMRGKHHFGAIQARAERLLLVDLRSADEWIDPASLEVPEGRALDKRELGMAEQLIRALDGDFEHGSFKDEYQARVQALIEAKARGERIPKPRAERVKPAPASLASALEASLRGLTPSRSAGAPAKRAESKRGHKPGKHAAEKERKSA